ncbi:hypothetical protein [Spirosoma sordidisoli]|uniref:Uncharacterized protein n=1 Tax=Spirosoma sordidisoli TaxID=2502893 RepID=A0A4Q2ULL8_9BACT|nr:hypothetical protein [Spirosoma sordidisoli]RYC69622.1 hypothetical protein EQG79_13545 [Spirosoma sordidisoli]
MLQAWFLFGILSFSVATAYLWQEGEFKKMNLFDFFDYSFPAIMYGPIGFIYLLYQMPTPYNKYKKYGAMLVIVSFLFISVTEGTKEFIGCVCKDGWRSPSTGRGTCSWHGGIDYYDYKYWWDK